MMSVKILEPAKREFIEAIKYYNLQTSGLGFEFETEILKSIDRICNYPESWSKIPAETRKCRCNRFPYNIIYFQENNVIVIVAIMHSKRKPEYWEKRIHHN